MLRSKYQNPSISVDESADIRKHRIVNISAADGQRSYSIASKDVGGTSWTIARTVLSLDLDSCSGPGPESCL